MKKALGIAGVLVLSASLLAACGNTAGPGNKNAGGGGGNRAGTQGTGGGTNAGAGTQGGNMFLGQNLRTDRNLESRIQALPGVRNATVMVSDSSAFVILDTNRAGTGGTTGGASGGTTGSTVGGASTGITGGAVGGTTGSATRGIATATALMSADADIPYEMRTRIADLIQRENPSIRNVFFVTKWR